MKHTYFSIFDNIYYNIIRPIFEENANEHNTKRRISLDFFSNVIPHLFHQICSNIYRVFPGKLFFFPFPSASIIKTSCNDNAITGLSKTWADAQAGLYLRCVHSSFCWFCLAASDMQRITQNVIKTCRGNGRCLVRVLLIE